MGHSSPQQDLTLKQGITGSLLPMTLLKVPLSEAKEQVYCSLSEGTYGGTGPFAAFLERE